MGRTESTQKRLNTLAIKMKRKIEKRDSLILDELRKGHAYSDVTVRIDGKKKCLSTSPVCGAVNRENERRAALGLESFSKELERLRAEALAERNADFVKLRD